MALLLKPGNSENCYCPSMPAPIEPYNPQPALKPNNYFHEVGAEMIGNRLIIRMEKNKAKKNKKKGAWEPPCDCDVIEIKRPTSTKPPRIVNGGDNNQILFRIHSKSHLNKKEDPNYKPQAIAYKINRCGAESEDKSRKITIYPQLGGPLSQDVYTNHITEGNHDVYLLRVKKKNDSAEGGNKRNLEVELRTPKPPPPLLPREIEESAQSVNKLVKEENPKESKKKPTKGKPKKK